MVEGGKGKIRRGGGTYPQIPRSPARKQERLQKPHKMGRGSLPGERTTKNQNGQKKNRTKNKPTREKNQKTKKTDKKQN